MSALDRRAAEVRIDGYLATLASVGLAVGVGSDEVQVAIGGVASPVEMTSLVVFNSEANDVRPAILRPKGPVTRLRAWTGDFTRPTSR